MAITFYYGSGSTFSWRVWLALEHKALDYELNILSFSAGDTRKPEYLAINPRHKVPVIMDDNFTLRESFAIIEYLEEQYPTAGLGSLFPADIRDRAEMRRMILEIDHYLGPSLSPLVKELFYKPEPAWDFKKIHQAKELAITEIENFTREIRGDYLLGDTATAADYALYPAIALALRFEQKMTLGIQASLSKETLHWQKCIEALPFFEKTIPPHWKE